VAQLYVIFYLVGGVITVRTYTHVMVDLFQLNTFYKALNI